MRKTEAVPGSNFHHCRLSLQIPGHCYHGCQRFECYSHLVLWIPELRCYAVESEDYPSWMSCVILVLHPASCCSDLSANPCWFSVNQLSLQWLRELKKPHFKFIVGLATMNVLSFLYALKYKK